MGKKPIPSFERVRELFDYTPETGILSWRIACGARGLARAGWDEGRGYIKVAFDGFTYYAHHIIFLWMTGRWVKMVDHRDTDKSNYRWGNLRDCTKTENQGNRTKRADNTSGHKNIHWEAGRKRWKVQIKKSEIFFMRRTRTLAGAIAIRRLKCAEMYGQFARVA